MIMGGVVKSIGKAVGGIFGGFANLLGAKPKAPAPQQPAATNPSVKASQAPADLGPPAIVGETGTMGASGESKGSSRRRGRVSTLLTTMGGLPEQLGGD